MWRNWRGKNWVDLFDTLNWIEKSNPLIRSERNENVLRFLVERDFKIARDKNGKVVFYIRCEAGLQKNALVTCKLYCLETLWSFVQNPKCRRGYVIPGDENCEHCGMHIFDKCKCVAK